MRNCRFIVTLDLEVSCYSRDFVDEVMHDFCPEGFLRRHPRHAKIVRTPLTSLGPNDEWAADGHDKLGSIGIAVYGFRDKASGYWLSLRVVPNNRLNTIIMYLYLSLVEEKGGEMDIFEQFSLLIFPSPQRHAAPKHDRLRIRNHGFLCFGKPPSVRLLPQVIIMLLLTTSS